jgi:uncharacterized membrane protein
MPSAGLLELLVALAIVAIYAIPILLVILIVQRYRSKARAADPARDPALDALRSRLASGDIDEAEYQRLRTVLHSS